MIKIRYSEIKLYCTILILHIFFIIPFTLITDYFTDNNINHYLEINHDDLSTIIIVSIIIIAPILEELIFRFPLKFNYLNIIVIPVILILSSFDNLLIIKIFSYLYALCIVIQSILKKDIKIIYFVSIIFFSTSFK